MNCNNNQNNNNGCGCNCNSHPTPAPELVDINMNVCDRNINMLPMLQTYTTKVLKPNIDGCCKKNILKQCMMNCENYKYVIKWDFDLNGETITVPENCILEFDGGSLKNGTIIGQDTVFINVGDVEIWGENLTREGTWREHSGGGGSGEEDKPYDPEAHSGLGRKTLKLKDGSNILTQEDFDQANTIYVVGYDFDLGGDDTVSITFDNVSSCTSPLWEGANRRLQKLRDEVGVGNSFTDIVDGRATTVTVTQQMINEQQQVVDNIPHYYYYAAVYGEVGKALCIDGRKFVFLDSTRTYIDRSRGNVFCGSENDVVYVATVYQGTYELKKTNAVTIPENCILQFEGGSIDNGVLYGNHTNISNESNAEIFGENITIAGLWDIDVISDTWFKYVYQAGVAKNEVIENMLHLTHDDYYSVIDISSGRNYLVEQKEVPVEHTGGIRQNIVRYAYGLYMKYYIFRIEPLIYDIVLFDLPSNVRIILNSTISMLPCAQGVYVMFEGYGKENITIEGTGTIYGDNCYQGNINTHDYTSLPCWQYDSDPDPTKENWVDYYGEWGYIIREYGCKNVNIFDITVKGSFGDSIGIGYTIYDKETKTQLLPPGEALVGDGAVVRNVKVDYTRRNGMSFACRNLLVDNCKISNTGITEIYGTAPKTGIDFEADMLQSDLTYGIDVHPETGNQNCVVRNCRFDNNITDITIVDNYKSDYDGTSVAIEDCDIPWLYITYLVKNVELKNCHIARIQYPYGTGNAKINLDNIKATGCVIDYMSPVLINNGIPKVYVPDDPNEPVDPTLRSNAIDVSESVVRYSQREELEVHRVQNTNNSRIDPAPEGVDPNLPALGNILYIRTDAAYFAIKISGYFAFVVKIQEQPDPVYDLRIARVEGTIKRTFGTYIMSEIKVFPSTGDLPDTTFTATPYYGLRGGKHHVCIEFRNLNEISNLVLSSCVRHMFNIQIDKYYNFTDALNVVGTQNTYAEIINKDSLPYAPDPNSDSDPEYRFYHDPYGIYRYPNFADGVSVARMDDWDRTYRTSPQYDGIAFTNGVIFVVYNKKKYRMPYSTGLWAGITANRPDPATEVLYEGFKYMDSTIARAIYNYDNRWVDSDFRAAVLNRGATEQRPTQELLDSQQKIVNGHKVYTAEVSGVETDVYKDGNEWKTVSDNIVVTPDSTPEPKLDPTKVELNRGFVYFDKTINRPVWWDGSTWIDAFAIRTTTLIVDGSDISGDGPAITYATKQWSSNANWSGHLIDVRNYRNQFCNIVSGVDNTFTFVKDSGSADEDISYSAGYGDNGYNILPDNTSTKLIVPSDAKYLWISVNGGDTTGSRKPKKTEFYTVD